MLLDFKHLQRYIQILSALGDTAFRELTIYFEHIPFDDLPEWILPHLNVCYLRNSKRVIFIENHTYIFLFQYGAIFIRGKNDYFFYEYMAEVCGDGLCPFTVYYSGKSIV